MSSERRVVFFETNVLIYALLTTDIRRQTANSLLLDGGLVSVQVLNEFVSIARRKHMSGWSDLRDALQIIFLLCGPAVSTEQERHEIAVNLAERYSLHIYDATIIASALLAGCETLYTETCRTGKGSKG